MDATMERIQPVLAVALRLLVGTLLALVLGIIGTGIAWGMFVFSGAETRFTMLALLMSGAGIGAGLGAGFAWLRLEGDSALAISTLAVVLALAGVAGALGGYEYGAGREEPCCAMPGVTPMSYTAFGATAAANLAALLVGIARSLVDRRRLPVR